MEIITETIYGYDSSVMKKIENRKVSPNSNSRREAGRVKNPIQCRVVVP